MNEEHKGMGIGRCAGWVIAFVLTGFSFHCHLPAASVGPSGYRNTFDTDPPAADWATFSRPGVQREIYNADTDVNATIRADVVTNRLTAAWVVGSLGTNAAWDFKNSYLQTWPSGNRYTALMNKLVNDSGTNATEIAISYVFRVEPGEPEDIGTRVYFSLTGATNSWTNLVTLNVTNVAIGSVFKSTNITVNWPHGANLYLLWIDDNADGGGGGDARNMIDDFAVAVTAGRSANIPPTLVVTAPADGTAVLEPASVSIDVSATHLDAAITNVEFFANGLKLGEDTAEPYAFAWPSPAINHYVLHAIATDDQGNLGTSAPVNLVVLDTVGTPFVRVTNPSDGFTAEGPANLIISAVAGAVDPVTHVEFFTNGVMLASDTSRPFEVEWAPAFGTNFLTAVAATSDGRRGTSAVVKVTIDIPPTNTFAPIIVARNPSAGATVTELTSIEITFNERVLNVDAGDLLVNGVPAFGLSGSVSNYTFTFGEPFFGPVSIGWAANHGIVDPTQVEFDEGSPGATWDYQFIDARPPRVLSTFPGAETMSTKLTETTVRFNEFVINVDAGDLLINNTPAVSVSGVGTDYTFSFTQPPRGRIQFSWRADHGISDVASNVFNALGPGATWNVMLNTITLLVHSNSTWRFLKGTAEASTPIDAWRQIGFDDSGWSNAFAPFFFGDPYSNGLANFTLLSDMEGNYSSIYLRKKFNVFGAALPSDTALFVQCDDGFVAWINGREVRRSFVPSGDRPHNGSASGSSLEFQNAGVDYAFRSGSLLVYPACWKVKTCSLSMLSTTLPWPG